MRERKPGCVLGTGIRIATSRGYVVRPGVSSRDNAAHQKNKMQSLHLSTAIRAESTRQQNIREAIYGGMKDPTPRRGLCGCRGARRIPAQSKQLSGQGVCARIQGSADGLAQLPY